jgi:hypothetical protein
MPVAWKKKRRESRIDPSRSFLSTEPTSGVRGRAPLEHDTSPQLPRARDYFAKVPVIVVPKDWITLARLDHRAGYLLSLLDGVIDIETVLDVSCMPSDETLGLLEELASLGIVTVR